MKPSEILRHLKEHRTVRITINATDWLLIQSSNPRLPFALKSEEDDDRCVLLHRSLQPDPYHDQHETAAMTVKGIDRLTGYVRDHDGSLIRKGHEITYAVLPVEKIVAALPYDLVMQTIRNNFEETLWDIWDDHYMDKSGPLEDLIEEASPTELDKYMESFFGNERFTVGPPPDRNELLEAYRDLRKELAEIINHPLSVLYPVKFRMQILNCLEKIKIVISKGEKNG